MWASRESVSSAGADPPRRAFCLVRVRATTGCLKRPDWRPGPRNRPRVLGRILRDNEIRYTINLLDPGRYGGKRRPFDVVAGALHLERDHNPPNLTSGPDICGCHGPCRARDRATGPILLLYPRVKFGPDLSLIFLPHNHATSRPRRYPPARKNSPDLPPLLPLPPHEEHLCSKSVEVVTYQGGSTAPSV